MIRTCVLRLAPPVIGALALTGCSASAPGAPAMSPAPPPASTPRPDMSEACGREAFSSHIGKVASEALLGEIAAARGDKPVRVLGPGSVMTMDYRPDRLNILTDKDNVITGLRCG